MPKTPPVSAAEAAAQKGIPKRTVLHAITMGWLKAHKLGGLTGAYVIEQRDLDRWADQREQASA